MMALQPITPLVVAEPSWASTHSACLTVGVLWVRAVGGTQEVTAGWGAGDLGSWGQNPGLFPTGTETPL